MSDLYISDTLSKEKVKFEPINSEHVKMYVCGPTVYSYAHLGNARSVVIYDILYRTLKSIYKNITYVRNITDVDDKIIAAAKESKSTINEITEKYSKAFAEDMQYINCLSPSIEPKATHNIDVMIQLIEKLIAAGHAYYSANHVYFDVKSYEDYGKLSGKKLEDLISGSRIEISESKKNPGDFVLWKPGNDGDEKCTIWDSPWGKGRPGWHIECSAMAYRYLGTNFDIHGGGADLKFPHHENEVAQSCCSFKDSHFAKYWIHNGFLTVNGEKMSKSLGNFITIHDLSQKGIKGEIIRYALLMTHYSKPMDWTQKSIDTAKLSLDKIYRSLEILDDNELSGLPQPSDEFKEILFNDLNTPLALQYLSGQITKINKEQNTQEKIHLTNELIANARMLGFINDSYDEWFKENNSASDSTTPEEIEKLIQERNEAKKNKNFARADEIRDYLKSINISLEDSPDGTKWHKS